MYACGEDSGSSVAENEYNDDKDENKLNGEDFKNSTITSSNYKT